MRPPCYANPEAITEGHSYRQRGNGPSYSIVVRSALNIDAAAQGRGGRGGAGGRGGRGGGVIPHLLMKTDAFEDGGIIPERYAGRGGNVRPGFTFSNISGRHRELRDLDAMKDVIVGKAAYVGRFRQ